MASFIKFCQIIVELSHGNESVEEEEEQQQEEVRGRRNVDKNNVSPITRGDIIILQTKFSFMKAIF